MQGYLASSSLLKSQVQKLQLIHGASERPKLSSAQGRKPPPYPSLSQRCSHDMPPVPWIQARPGILLSIDEIKDHLLSFLC